MTAPLLVELELLVDAEGEIDERLLGRLGKLNQTGVPLIAVARRPDAWRPTRSGMDTALDKQGRVNAAIHRAGGALDGVLYLDFGLFGRRRRRIGDLENLAARYNAGVTDLCFIARPGRLAEAADQAGARVLRADDGGELMARLNERLGEPSGPG